MAQYWLTGQKGNSESKSLSLTVSNIKSAISLQLHTEWSLTKSEAKFTAERSVFLHWGEEIEDTSMRSRVCFCCLDDRFSCSHKQEKTVWWDISSTAEVCLIWDINNKFQNLVSVPPRYFLMLSLHIVFNLQSTYSNIAIGWVKRHHGRSTKSNKYPISGGKQYIRK